MNKEIKYSIKEMFGGYSIVIEEEQTAQVLYDINENIINIIKQLEQKIDKIMEIIELNQYSYGYQIKAEILGGDVDDE